MLTLAEGENDIISLLAVVVLVIVGSLIQRVQKKAQQKKADAEYQHRLSQRQAAEQAAGSSRQSATPATSVQRPQEAAPASPLQVDRRLVEHYQRTMGILPQQAMPQPPPIPFRPSTKLGVSSRRVMMEEEEESVRVEQELQIQRRRMEEQDRRRQQRMRTLAPAEADTAAIETRILHVQPAARATPGATELAAAGAFRIDDPRKAMIYYEIFSLPKALREHLGLWDY